MYKAIKGLSFSRKIIVYCKLWKKQKLKSISKKVYTVNDWQLSVEQI